MQSDTLGGITGWLITKGAPKEAAEFLKFFISQDVQTAAGGRQLPHSRVQRRGGGVCRPFMRNIAQNLARSKYHQNFLDQALGPSVGRVVNDVDGGDRRRQHDAEGRRQGHPGRVETGQLVPDAL